MNTSQSAPSWICVLSVPEESKLNWMVTLGFRSMNLLPISVSVSVMEAAAKTISSTGSAAGVSSSAGASSSGVFSSSAGFSSG